MPARRGDRGPWRSDVAFADVRPDGIDLPEQADPRRRPLPAGGAGRRHHAPGRQPPEPEPRSTGGDREQAGRRRQHRHRVRGARAQRRLHAVGDGEQLRRQSQPLQQGELRPGEGLHAGHRIDPHAVGADGDGGLADHVGAGHHRAGQGKAGWAKLRLRRQRLARPFQRRAVQGRRRHRHAAHAVQGVPRTSSIRCCRNRPTSPFRCW